MTDPHALPSLDVIYAVHPRNFYYRRTRLRAAVALQEFRTYVEPTWQTPRIAPYRPGSTKHGFIVVATEDDAVTDDMLFERAAQLRQDPPTLETKADGVEVFVAQPGSFYKTWAEHIEHQRQSAAKKRKAAREDSVAARKQADIRRRIESLSPYQVLPTGAGYFEIRAENLLDLLERLDRAKTGS